MDNTKNSISQKHLFFHPETGYLGVALDDFLMIFDPREESGVKLAECRISNTLDKELNIIKSRTTGIYWGAKDILVSMIHEESELCNSGMSDISDRVTFLAIPDGKLFCVNYALTNFEDGTSDVGLYDSVDGTILLRFKHEGTDRNIIAHDANWKNGYVSTNKCGYELNIRVAEEEKKDMKLKLGTEDMPRPIRVRRIRTSPSDIGATIWMNDLKGLDPSPLSYIHPKAQSKDGLKAEFDEQGRLVVYRQKEENERYIVHANLLRRC